MKVTSKTNKKATHDLAILLMGTNTKKTKSNMGMNNVYQKAGGTKSVGNGQAHSKKNPNITTINAPNKTGANFVSLGHFFLPRMNVRAAPMAKMGERAAVWCLNLVARILWRPSIARQTGKKKNASICLITCKQQQQRHHLPSCIVSH